MMYFDAGCLLAQTFSWHSAYIELGDLVWVAKMYHKHVSVCILLYA